MRWQRALGFASLAATLLCASACSKSNDPVKTKVLLLGDSSTLGSVCRQVVPQGPHLEQIIQRMLDGEPGLPPVEVVNQGRDGEFIHRLLHSGRYDREIAPLRNVGIIVIRYGVNDWLQRPDFETTFPADFAELVGRLRHDFPAAEIVAATNVAYLGPEQDGAIDLCVKRIAEAEHLPLLDIRARYVAEMQPDPNALCYRHFPLKRIPENRRALVQPFVRGDVVVVMDNRLDPHFRDLPGWFDERHPNLTGYHVIGDATAKFLATWMYHHGD